MNIHDFDRMLIEYKPDKEYTQVPNPNNRTSIFTDEEKIKMLKSIARDQARSKNCKNLRSRQSLRAAGACVIYPGRANARSRQSLRT